MIQVKIGTTEWTACPSGTPESGYVLFTGTFLYEADGITPRMIWDAGLANIRAMTDPERVQRDADTALALLIAKGAIPGAVTGVRLANDIGISTLGLGDVGLNFQLAPNTHYEFTFYGGYITAAGATGLKLAIDGPANPAHFSYIGTIYPAANAVAVAAAATYNNAQGPATGGGAAILPFEIKGSISTGAAGGTLKLRFASEVGASLVTIKAGSVGRLISIG